MHKFISGKSETVNLTYRSDLEHAELTTLLQEHLERDRILTRTTKGIHKDDLVFTIEDYPMKRFGSQGQLKTFILGPEACAIRIIKARKTGKTTITAR